tara:strand:- start:5593 stop:7524 length:1932 start_codon:yes stop_codon:yes gene_type:complete
MKSFLKQHINLFKVYLFAISLFSIFRFVYLIRFGEEGIFNQYPSDLFAAFITGIRFDAQILCYSFGLLFALNFLHLIPEEKFRKNLVTFSKIYTIVILSLLVLVLLIDQQFYTYFQSHINILVYGFLEDDTKAVLASVWSDHPLIRLVIIFLILVFVIVKVVRSIYNAIITFPKDISIASRIIVIILSLSLFSLGIRGSIGVFPLQIDDSTVSANRFINNLTLNGVYTFVKAIEERNKSRKILSKKDVLKRSEYSSLKQLISDYYSLPQDSFSSDNYLDYLFETTPYDSILEEYRPNVIFILMESFGGYYLNFHSKRLNLLGELEEHLEEGVLFSNFLSSTQGTIYSLENIIINKNGPILSSTNRRFESFRSSIAFPYYNEGYETIFITGGKLGWRNLSEFIPNQFFKQAYGKSKIIRDNPKAISNIWGVYDEFLFEDIFNQLDNSTSKLIFALSTSNHTPYKLPNDYIDYPINISDSLENLIIANKDIAQANFRAYQYANDCLGKFLTRLKNSVHGKNTIVAVSGDHNSYALFPIHNSTMQEKDNHIVPFFLSIPDQYKKRLHINEQRFGSHKDIFPTLINLSLSNTTYFSLGNNLFDKSIADSLFYGINESYYFGDPRIPHDILDKKVNARLIINKYYFAQ